MTAAHYQTTVLAAKLREWVPEHDPRETDPHYALFRHAKKQMRALDLPCWRCGVHYADLVKRGDPPTAANPLAAYQLEAHHSDLEFSLLNAVDVARWWDSSTREDPGFMVESFSRVDGWLHEHPEYAKRSHEEIFTAYMESDGNLLQLCLAPESSVLMADGNKRAIERVRVGDRVLGPDGHAHSVSATSRRQHNGQLVVLDGRRLTTNHPVLTPDGWLPAGLVREGQVLGEFIRVTVAEMLGLRRIEAQVLDAVVRPIVVDVMHPLLWGKASPQMLFHNPPMFRHAHDSTIAPDLSPDVSLWGEARAKELTFATAAGNRVQRLEPTRVGTELTASSILVAERRPATLTGPLSGVDALVADTPFGRTGAATRAVALRDFGSDQEHLAADTTGSPDAWAASDAWWRPVGKVWRERFDGFVHDISVSGYPAFITDGLVVHNCDVCHRSKDEGIHWIPYPDWRARAVWRQDLPAHIQAVRLAA